MAKTESKSYDPASIEKNIFEMWIKGGFFHPQPDARPPEKRFSMVIPPPNVTGALHLGHALNNTLQDILIRKHRMMGDNTLWVVGTDHAGIATQATVEKTIRKDEGKSRHDLGRDELVRRIWEWKEKYGSRIVEQLKLMGCSCDYERERFTLDEGCARAVRETFFKLFRDGLIYRGKRLVNWDTQLQTAVADDEVYHETVKGHFYHLKYPIIDPQSGEPTHVHVATTRPETMLGDTAVAVHPDPAAALDRLEEKYLAEIAEAAEKDKAGLQQKIDEIRERRTTHLPVLLKLRDMAKAGRMVMLPLADRPIPLITDEWAKPELGSGCVKITPAHDPNDYEVYHRSLVGPRGKILEDRLLRIFDDPKFSKMKFGLINIMTPDGRVNENGGNYAGQKLSEARKNVVADLEALGLVEKIEERNIELAHSDRSKTEIQPYLSDQWFVRMGDLDSQHATKTGGLRHEATGLAQMAIEAVKRGDVKFHPARYENTYVDWLSEKRDWCISRQLWWGHQIPVWSKVVETEGKPLSLMLKEIGIYKLLLHESLGRVATIQSMELGTTDDIIVTSEGLEKVGWTEDGVRKTVDLDGELASGHYKISLSVINPDHIELLNKSGYEQDPDVLDTWFSSALWPHSTLGWPEPDKQDNLLDYYYPTSVLSTAREIITLWVARMVITGLYNVGEVPFKDVVIHPVIQDGQGRKMSKSLGNGVDPVDIIEEYGADALRFTLSELATETQDIRLPVTPKKLPDGRTINVSDKFEKGRNFCNKLWQASTGYVMRNLEGYAPQPLDISKLRLEDRWILSRLTACQLEFDAALANYKFADAAAAVYHFMWDEYCSWYIEMTKSRLMTNLTSPDPSRDREEAVKQTPEIADNLQRTSAQQILVHCLDQLLRMLHPIIPFITEALWAELNRAAPHRGLTTITDYAASQPVLITAAWPVADPALRDENIEQQMAVLHGIIRAARDIRAVVNDYRGKAKQPSVRTLPAVSLRADNVTCQLIETYQQFIIPLAGCESLQASPSQPKPGGAMSRVIGGMQLYSAVGDLIDLSEVARTEHARLEELRKVLAREEQRLSNADFVARADANVVEAAKQRAAELASQIKIIEENLAELN